MYYLSDEYRWQMYKEHFLKKKKYNFVIGKAVVAHGRLESEFDSRQFHGYKFLK